MIYYTYTDALKNTSIICLDQNGVKSFIPLDLENMDYQAYLAWVAEGNTATEWTPEP